MAAQSEDFDGLGIARRRIAQEMEQRTGFLDLGQLGLTELPAELFRLRHLRWLNLGFGIVLRDQTLHESSEGPPNTVEGQLDRLAALPDLEALSLAFTLVTNLAPLASLTALQSLDCSRTKVADLSPLASLTTLQSITCSHTKVADLSPLASLTALQSLTCSSTRVVELSSLASLSALQSLTCSRTQVSDLAPLVPLTALRSLTCSRTPVADLAPLACLKALQFLNCSRTRVAELAPLALLTALQSLNFSDTKVADLAPLASLTALQSINCSDTKVADLTPLASLTALRSLNCSRTRVADLAPLASLTALQSLDCSCTRVAGLAPLASPPVLQSLSCSDTQVADLAPLARVAALQSLDCSRARVPNLAPLASLTALESLDCSGTKVADLAPLASLTALESLNCASTDVANLAPLASLTALQSLSCSNTKVADLAPLARLPALQSLDCSRTRVADLAPLESMTALQSLSCSDTQVADLAPLAPLTALKKLECSFCHLTCVPGSFWEKPSLEKVFLSGTRVPDVPPGVLSRGNNGLASLRAHFRDLEDGAVSITDVKLLVLGNGKVGKTQVCRRLRGDAFEPRWDSTHGIQVTSASLPATDGAEVAHLHIWDFGGQEIYHGTHALFVRSRALFLLLWAKDTENADTYEHSGILFRNRPLAYWVDYVRHFGDADSPVLIVQTHCDRPEDEVRRPPVPQEALDALGYAKERQYSAKPPERGRAALDEALREAINWMRDRQGTAMIGAGRMRVQRRLEAMRNADAAVPPEQRQHRTLSRDTFRRLCDEAKGVSSPDDLLSYLHSAGIVFYRPGLFEDQVVLDQGWALDAIYAVFNREKCYRQLRQLRGRFGRPLLEALVWQGYGVEEQKLFLSMMQSCGICFVHRQGTIPDEDDAEYIAPDLLPERADLEDQLAEKWDDSQPFESAEFDFALLHPGIVRGVISRIGREAGANALYWQGGVCVYERTTRSHTLLDQQMTDAWRGRIRLRTQGGQAAILLDRLIPWIEEESARSGAQPVAVRRRSPGRSDVPLSIAAPRATAETERPPLAFDQPAATQPEWFVSYAWGDATPVGRARETIVDDICAAAEQRGIRIQRDKTALRMGDRISTFMRRIGRGEKVFVVLSEKYLRSPWCMFELFDIWRNSRGEEDAFLHRIRVYTLDDARISTPDDRMDHAEFWQQKHDTLEARIQRAPAAVGEEDFRQFKLMGEFYRRVSDILAPVADMVQPRSLDQLREYGFDDLPTGEKPGPPDRSAE